MIRLIPILFLALILTATAAPEQLTNPVIKGAATVDKPALGATTSAGVILQNPTAAASGAQQVSPATEWSGFGWKTNTTAASQAVKFRSYLLPTQSTNTPHGSWLLQSSINGGAWTTRMTVSDQTGTTFADAVAMSSTLNVTGGANFSSLSAANGAIDSLTGTDLNFSGEANFSSANITGGAITGITEVVADYLFGTTALVIGAGDAPPAPAVAQIKTTSGQNLYVAPFASTVGLVASNDGFNAYLAMGLFGQPIKLDSNAGAITLQGTGGTIIGSSGTAIKSVLSAVKSPHSVGAITAGTTATATLAITGATTTSVCLVSHQTAGTAWSAGLPAPYAKVTSADNVTVYFPNPTTGSITPPASQDFRVVVINF